MSHGDDRPARKLARLKRRCQKKMDFIQEVRAWIGKNDIRGLSLGSLSTWGNPIRLELDMGGKVYFWEPVGIYGYNRWGTDCLQFWQWLNRLPKSVIVDAVERYSHRSGIPFE